MKRKTSAPCSACSSPVIKKTKVQAQRKFAQGSNNCAYTTSKITKTSEPCVFSSSPVVEKINLGVDDRELNNFASVPSIDDFLTFLCYRETEVLPERLAYLNTPKYKTLPSKKKSLKVANNTLSISQTNKHFKNQNFKCVDKFNSNLKAKKTIPEAKNFNSKRNPVINSQSNKVLSNRSSKNLDRSNANHKIKKNITRLKAIPPRKKSARLNNRSALQLNKVFNNQSSKCVSQSNGEFKSNKIISKYQLRLRGNKIRHEKEIKEILQNSKTTSKAMMIKATKPIVKIPNLETVVDFKTSVDSKKSTVLPSVTELKICNDRKKLPESEKSAESNVCCKSEVTTVDSKTSVSCKKLNTNESKSKENKKSVLTETENVYESGKLSTIETKISAETKKFTVSHTKSSLENKKLAQAESITSIEDKKSISNETKNLSENRKLSTNEIRINTEIKKAAITHSKNLLDNKKLTQVESEILVESKKLNLGETKSSSENRKSSTSEIKKSMVTQTKNLSENKKSTQVKSLISDQNKNSSITETKNIENSILPTTDVKTTVETKKSSQIHTKSSLDNKKSTQVESAPLNDSKNVVITENRKSSTTENKKSAFPQAKSSLENKKLTAVESLTPTESKKSMLTETKNFCENRRSSTTDTKHSTETKKSAVTHTKNSLENKKSMPIESGNPALCKKSMLTETKAAHENRKLSVTDIKPTIETKKSAATNTKNLVENKKSVQAESVISIESKKSTLIDTRSSCGNRKLSADEIKSTTEIKKSTSVHMKNLLENKNSTQVELITIDENKKSVLIETKNSCENRKLSTDETKPITETKKPIVAHTKPLLDNKLSTPIECKKIIFKKNTSPSSDSTKNEISPRKAEAFSADNEKSVYAFEPDLPTTSPPFRRLKPLTPLKTFPASNSIAVQVNFENDSKNECTSSPDTHVSSTTDCGDQVFYIPIQTSDTNSTLGVAVKLGTDGPNQKIIMSATLVTNTSTFTANTATTSNSRSCYVESSCVQTEPLKLINTEPIPITPVIKKPTKTIINSDKTVTSTQSLDTSNSLSSTSILQRVGTRKMSAKSTQSVKIVKISRKKKIPPSKVKSRSPKNKLNKKSSCSQENIPGEILEAPTFYPTENEFNDPMEYIDSIRSKAEKYGLCRIVPPSNFRPECKVADEMRFTAYNQYVHKMLHRWGPNVKELIAIKKYLATQNITINQAPLIGGIEVDLPRLYQIVQQCGGLKEVIEKERWQQVADVMKIPKSAQDRITKLDDIYCKYLLPYDILPQNERKKLFEDVQKDWHSHLDNSDTSDIDLFDDIDECILKGRTMPLSCFYRIARNIMMMCFGNTEGENTTPTELIEKEFWNHILNRKSHICVHSGSIDSGTYGYGFSIAKNSTFRKHPWNLKVLTNNSASILRSLGPIIGVTVPTLHVGMLYSACCWYRDPHGLPWVEYLHTGANKIWYGIPDDQNDKFRAAMLITIPRYIRNKKVWLASDTAMIPPHMLTRQSVTLSKVVQHPGQFIVVFPKAFTSSISTGYLVSESVYFAHASWLDSAKQIFTDMQESCEPSVFSLEQLLICVANDTRASYPILEKILPMLIELRDTEIASRKQLKELGLNSFDKLEINKKRKLKASFNDENIYECEICRSNLFVSLIINTRDQCNYCLKHAITFLLKKPNQVKHCKLLCAFSEEELNELIEKVRTRMEMKSNRKSHGK